MILDHTKNIKKLSLPNSISFSTNNFFEKEPNRLLSIRKRTNVIVANDEQTERKIAVIAKELGYNNIEILKGGLENFNSEILNFSE